MIKAGYDVPDIESTGGINASMMAPFHIDRLGLLFTRVFSDLKGITSAMDAQISRILAQGIVDGDGPALLARKLVSTINGTGMGIPSAAGLTSRTSILGKYTAAGKTCTISINS